MIACFPITDMSRWIKEIRDLDMPVLAANDDRLLSFEELADFVLSTESKSDPFNPVLRYEDHDVAKD